MRVNALRFVQNQAVARLYYAVRSFDPKGQGWIKVPHCELNRRLGLSDSRVRALLRAGRELGWFYHVERALGFTYVKYASERRFSQLHGKAIGHIQLKLLRQREDLSARVTHIRVINEQEKVERKLRHAIWTGKFPKQEVFDAEHPQAKLRTKGNGVRRRRVFLDHTYVPCLSQVTLAQRLGMPLRTLKKHLRGVPAIVPFTPQTQWDKQAEKACPQRQSIPQVFDEETFRIYQRRPNFYLDTCSEKAISRTKVELALKKLDVSLLKIVQAGAFAYGFEWSLKGARAYVLKLGWKRVWQNLDPYLREHTEAGRKRERSRAVAFRKYLEGKNKPKASTSTKAAPPITNPQEQWLQIALGISQDASSPTRPTAL